ncbi:hypothetical protein Tco_1202788 [Tanacetum coccineum]
MEWSKFVTDVKLVKDLHTTNVDQLHAYLQQHERHANEVRLMHERNSDPLALVASHQLTQSAYQSHLHNYPNSLPQHHVSPYPSSQFVTPYQTQQFTTSQSTPLSITYPSNEYQASGRVILPSSVLSPKRKRDETWFNDKVFAGSSSSKWLSVNKEKNSIFANPGLPTLKPLRLAIPTMLLLIKAEIWMLDSDYE